MDDYPVIEDFDFTTHAGGGCPADTMARFDELRARFDVPFFRSRLATGYWVFLNDVMVRDALHDPELFSSSAMHPLDPDPPYRWIPLMVDPPEHSFWRRLLNPHFSPGRVDQLEPAIRATCVELIESFRDRGGCDFMAEFAQEFPIRVFLEYMGWPTSDTKQFMAWVAGLLHQTMEDDPDLSKRNQTMMEVMGYFVQLIQQRREQPTGDLLSEAVTWTRDGEPVADSDLMNLCLTLFLGGLDTVTQQLGYTFLHLATHPEDRERLIREPDVVPDAVEEFIRTYAIAGPARKVMRDIEFHGCPLRKGDTVLVAMTASCRDPETTPDPSRIDYDRGPTRHLGFGIGIHRCLGAHLARRELKVALEEWHRLIPEYQLASGVTRDDLHEHFGGVAGFDRLPLAWPR